MMSSKKINKSSIKIIAGKYKGKILHMDILPNTRPTKSIVKESLFDTLQDSIKDKVLVEVFAGYGSVGFEAFSRGAKKVIFIEKDSRSYSVLFHNINLFNSSHLIAYNEDSLIFLEQFCRDNEFDILYLDPPFCLDYNVVFALLSKINLINKIVVIEHISSFVMPQNLNNLSLYKSRKFGKTTLSYYF